MIMICFNFNHLHVRISILHSISLNWLLQNVIDIDVLLPHLLLIDLTYAFKRRKVGWSDGVFGDHPKKSIQKERERESEPWKWAM